MIITLDELSNKVKNQKFKATKVTIDQMFLFLDFDGVLHPYKSFHTREGLFAKKFFIEELLRTYDKVSVVVSSSWGKHYDLNELKAYFSEDVRHRFIGYISNHSDNRGLDIYKWLISHGEVDTPWVAVDDMAYFDDGSPVVWTDSRTGLTTETANMLEEVIKDPDEFMYSILKRT
jgi:hypothetical protein